SIKEVDGSELILRCCLPCGWPDGRGTGGRIIVESVAGCSWNGWPDARGIRSFIGKSYVRDD
ncbi:hypothetical protein, partial [Pseudomonas veronii]|uniref:hypothetical protein n=1 Tax=Pseudomonas veronii TaxID=76761 RepID=UPI001C8BD7FE